MVDRPRDEQRRRQKTSWVGWLVVILALARIEPTLAETVALDFESPVFLDGQSLSVYNDIAFLGGVAVFRPTSVSTASGSQAIKVPTVCESADCRNDSFRMIIRFGQALPFRGWLPRGANSVSMRVGSDYVPLCFPEGRSCDIYARLIGYDQAGTPIADSRDVFLFSAIAVGANIAQELRVIDPSTSGRIARVELRLGKGLFLRELEVGLPGQPQIDDLTVDLYDGPPRTAVAPPPPVINILQPAQNQPQPFPYAVRLRGSVVAPGGVYAFCYRLNDVAPTADGCRDNARLTPNSTFDIPIDNAMLRPGANTLSVSLFDLWGQSGSQSSTFIVGPPPPPSVAIYHPSANDWLSNNIGASVSGAVFTVGALQGFCVLVDAQGDPAPADCHQHLANLYQGPQQLNYGVSLPATQLPSGHHTISVFAIDRWNQVGSARVALNVPTDFRIVAMEITQGIQKTELPVNTTGSQQYSGVKLRRGVPTVVRVFVNSPFSSSYAGSSVPVLLTGFKPHPRWGEEALGAILPDSVPVSIPTGGLDVPLSMRADANGGYVFTLPASWTMANGLRLTATLRVNWPVRECPTCLANNTFTLFGISFEVPPTLTISPIELYWTRPDGSEESPPPPSNVFARNCPAPPATCDSAGVHSAGVLDILPVGAATVSPYVRRIDITDLVTLTTTVTAGGGSTTSASCDEPCRNRAHARVTNAEIADYPGYTIGIAPGTLLRGLELPETFFRLQGILDAFFVWEPIAVASAGPLLTSAGHEFVHQLGYYHAGSLCPDVDMWILWPPDDKGLIQGVGLDRRPNSAGKPGQYRILVPGTANLPGGKADYFDLMSYCTGGDESIAWISVRNWDAFGGPFPNGILPDAWTTSTGHIVAPQQAHKGRPIEGGTLNVLVLMSKEGRVTTTRVKAGSGWMSINPPKTDYVVTVRDSSKNLVARVPAMVSIAKDGSSSTLTADVPAKGVSHIEIERDGKVIHGVARSSHAPKIELTSPAKGAWLSRDGNLQLKWNAVDPDGDSLEVRVDYSPGPDEPFRTVFVGPSRGEAKFPGRLLSRSANGRIRVVVNDGFNEAEAFLESLRINAAPPLVEIVRPANNTEFVRTMPIRLQVAAFGDNMRPLPSNQIEWSLDGAALGTGTEVEIRNLKLGRHVAIVKAREGNLVGTAQIVFTVIDVLHELKSARQKPELRKRSEGQSAPR